MKRLEVSYVNEHGIYAHFTDDEHGESIHRVLTESWRTNSEAPVTFDSAEGPVTLTTVGVQFIQLTDVEVASLINADFHLMMENPPTRN